ncbi:MAG: hypothetical protein AB1Z65_15075 [Candidatus Sulfomarinibacteraceae bacterium]
MVNVAPIWHLSGTYRTYLDSVLGAEDDESVECRDELDALRKGAPSADPP